MSYIKVNLIEVEFDEIKDRIDIDLVFLSFRETIIENILWKGKCISNYLYIILYIILILYCLCIKYDYKNLFNFITGLLCIYTGTSFLESDFSLLKSIKTEGKTHLSNILLEGCIHSKQFNYVIQI